jgi:hypothetical protein
LPKGIAVKLGYVGGHGRNLPNSLNINQLPDGQYSQAIALNTKVANPYAGLGQWGKGTVAKYQTLLPFPQYQGITMATSQGKSNYNSLNVKVQKRFNRGVTLLAAYTWASNWDNIWGAYGSSNSLNSGNNGPQDIYDPSKEYARATNDIPNRLSLAGTLELPFGRGKPFLSGVNRWVDLAVGGWRFNNITVIQNGAPLAITQGNSNSSYGNGTQRPSLMAGSNPCKSGSPEGRLNNYFDGTAYSITAPFAYGTASRASNCYGPGYINTDLSLNKDFRMTERVHAEFRAEALNAFNTPQFATPNLSVGSAIVNNTTGVVTTTRNSGAGQITGTLGFPRLVQLGGRLTF